MSRGGEQQAPVANALAFSSALLAAGLTFRYLSSGLPWTLVHVTLAVALLGWPLRKPWPLTRKRLRSVAVWWTAGGIVGAYLFGLWLLFAGVLVLLALGVDRLVRTAST